jgi:hypothetical protein
MIDTIWNLLQQRELRDLNSKLSNVKTQDGFARDTLSASRTGLTSSP